MEKYRINGIKNSTQITEPSFFVLCKDGTQKVNFHYISIFIYIVQYKAYLQQLSFTSVYFKNAQKYDANKRPLV